MKRWHWIGLVVVGLALVSAGLAALHWVLSKPDRLQATAEQDNLQQVRDALLQYEDEHKKLPLTLDELVPQYVRLDQIKSADGLPRLVFRPETRTIAEVNGAKIRGLFTYTQTPASMRLMELQPAPVPLAFQPPPVKPGEPVKPSEPVKPADPVKPPVDPNLPTTPNTRNYPPQIHPAEPPVKPDVPVKPDEPVKPPLPVAPVAPAPVVPVAPVVADVAQAATGPFADGRIFTPKDPGYKDPPAGCIVFEAENYSSTNYGWEVHGDDKAGGGAYLHCKEGIANGPAQTEYKAGNFYDVKGTKEVTYLRYYFHVPKAGKYYIYGRMWTTDTHCSNNLAVSVDDGGPYKGGMENRTPFRWLWSPVAGNPHRLAAGDHYIHIFIHEDGIKVDQYMLSPEAIDENAPAYKANYVAGKDTEFEAKTGADAPGVALSYDLQSMIFTPKMPVDGKLAVRRVRPMTGMGHFKTVLQGAGPDGGELTVGDLEVDLAKLPELCEIPLSFKELAPEKMARREYLLHSDLIVDGKSVAQCHIPLIRPYAWEIFGPGGFLKPETQGPLDGNGEPKPGEKRAWEPFADTSFDHFGVLDFGVQYDGNMKHPRENATVYAQTRVEVAEDAEYLLKLQADDQMILWLDGKEIFRHDEIMPVTRGVDRQTVKLTKGTHTFRFRMNQYSGPWQAYMMIRAKDDDLCSVVGLPLEEKAQEAAPQLNAPQNGVNAP